MGVKDSAPARLRYCEDVASATDQSPFGERERPCPPSAFRPLAAPHIFGHFPLAGECGRKDGNGCGGPPWGIASKSARSRSDSEELGASLRSIPTLTPPGKGVMRRASCRTVLLECRELPRFPEAPQPPRRRRPLPASSRQEFSPNARGWPAAPLRRPPSRRRQHVLHAPVLLVSSSTGAAGAFFLMDSMALKAEAFAL